MVHPLISSFFTPITTMKADWLPLSAWFGHVPFAFWLIENLQPQTLVELGTHYGTSYCAFNQAIQTLDLATQSYAVDTWEGDEHSGFYGDEIFSELSTYHDQRYSSFSRLIRSTFDEAVHYFPDRSIDLLHIDGLHTYEAVKHDFETWFPKLSNRAIVLFHDINVRERSFGVWQLWEELRQAHPHFTFVQSHGLGVLQIGQDIPEALQLLFQASADPEATAQIREIFTRLGLSIADAYAKQQLQAELQKLQKEHQALYEWHQQEVKAKEWFEQQWQANQTLVAQTQAELERSSAELTQAAAQTQAAEQQLSSLQDSYKELETHYKALETHYRALEGYYNTHKTQLEQTQTQLQLAQQQRQAEQQEIEVLRFRLERSDIRIAQLKDKLERVKVRFSDCQTEVEAMKTSKFWQLRSRWFKVKKLVGLGEGE